MIQDQIQYLLVGRPGRSYEDVLYTDGHKMVARKGVAEQISLVDGRHVLQNEVFVSLCFYGICYRWNISVKNGVRCVRFSRDTKDPS